jgi:hypothetical protein
MQLVHADRSVATHDFHDGMFIPLLAPEGVRSVNVM